MMEFRKVLIFDDDINSFKMLENNLKNKKINSDWCTKDDEVIKLIKKNFYCGIFINIENEGVKVGTGVLREIKEELPEFCDIVYPYSGILLPGRHDFIEFTKEYEDILGHSYMLPKYKQPKHFELDFNEILERINNYFVTIASEDKAQIEALIEREDYDNSNKVIQKYMKIYNSFIDRKELTFIKISLERDIKFSIEDNRDVLNNSVYVQDNTKWKLIDSHKDVIIQSQKICALEINYLNEDNTQQGNGFLISPNVIITSRHLAKENIDFNQSIATFIFNSSDEKNKVKIDCKLLSDDFYSSNELDFSIIRIELINNIDKLNNEMAPLVIEYSSNIIKNQEFTIIGFDMKYNFNDLSENRSKINYLDDKYFYHSLTVDNGFSGCPIFSKDMKVIGMHKSTGNYVANLENLSKCVRMDAVLKQLRNDNSYWAKLGEQFL